MAEIELSALSWRVFAELMKTLEQVQTAVQMWQKQCNSTQAVINWRFTNEEAHLKLKHLYPSIEVW